MGKQKESEKTNGRRANKKETILKNRFRSGGEENERKMTNSVMQEMRVL